MPNFHPISIGLCIKKTWLKKKVGLKSKEFVELVADWPLTVTKGNDSLKLTVRSWSPWIYIRLEGPEDPHLRNSWFRRSRDPAPASKPLTQTPWGLTGRAWLQAATQRVVVVAFPPLNSLGIDSRNDSSGSKLHFEWSIQNWMFILITGRLVKCLYLCLRLFWFWFCLVNRQAL